jgi:hypothetical protein
MMSNGNGHDGYQERSSIPEPPAVVGSWTFPMKGMFPPPRPFTSGTK